MTRLSPRLRGLATIVLVVALGLLAGWTVLMAERDGGGASTRAAGQEEPTETPTATEPGSEEPSEVGPLVTYEVYLARDPFAPVVPEPVQGGAPTTDTPVPGTDPSASPTPSPSPGSTPSPGTTPTPTPSPSPGSTEAPGCTQNGEVVCDGRVVELVDVQQTDGEPVAVVRVGQQVYEVRDGDRFAGSFEVLAIVDSCVSLLFGDDSFSLCEGEAVLK